MMEETHEEERKECGKKEGRRVKKGESNRKMRMIVQYRSRLYNTTVDCRVQQ